DFVITAPGTYYLRVAGGGVVHYQVRIGQVRGPQLEPENNNNQSQATLLNLSGSGGLAQAKAAGALPASDSSGDYFRLNTLNVSVNLPAFGALAAGNVRLSVERNGSSTPLATSTTGSLTYIVAAYTVSGTGTVPAGTRTGLYSVLLVADASGNQ